MVHRITLSIAVVILTLWFGLNSLSQSATIDKNAVRQAELDYTISLIKKLPIVKCSDDMIELYAQLINLHVTKDLRPIMIAILQVESKFNYKAINNNRDFGVAQINYFTWKKFFSISTKEELLDPSFNIKIASKILKLAYDTHHKKANWYGWYHSWNHTPRKIYTERINSVLKQIGYHEPAKK